MELRTRDLGVRLGQRQVLDDVSAIFAPGRITVLLGPNGAGKSSLLKSLVGLIPGQSGDVLLNRRPLRVLSMRDRARAMAYLAQDPVVHWNLIGRDLVALGRLPHRGAFGGPSRADMVAVDRALADTGTQDFADRPVHSLSGGERARLLLARMRASRNGFWRTNRWPAWIPRTRSICCACSAARPTVGQGCCWCCMI